MAEKSLMCCFFALAVVTTSQCSMDVARADTDTDTETADADAETAASSNSAFDVNAFDGVAAAFERYRFDDLFLPLPRCDCRLSENPAKDEPPREWKLVWRYLDGGTYYCALYECIPAPAPGCYSAEDSQLFKLIELDPWGNPIRRPKRWGLWTRTILSKDLSKCT